MILTGVLYMPWKNAQTDYSSTQEKLSEQIQGSGLNCSTTV